MDKFKLKINSLIENIDENGLPSSDAEREEISTGGSLVPQGSGYLITYTEAKEGGEVKCEITVLGDKVSVVRAGSVACKMHFKCGMTHRSIYSVPPFSFDMTIETVRVKSSIGASGGELDLLYKMNIGGQDKRCRFRLNISKQD